MPITAACRRSDRNEDQIGLGNGSGQIHAERQPAGLDVLQEVVQRNRLLFCAEAYSVWYGAGKRDPADRAAGVAEGRIFVFLAKDSAVCGLYIYE